MFNWKVVFYTGSHIKKDGTTTRPKRIVVEGTCDTVRKCKNKCMGSINENVPDVAFYAWRKSPSWSVSIKDTSQSPPLLVFNTLGYGRYNRFLNSHKKTWGGKGNQMKQNKKGD